MSDEKIKRKTSKKRFSIIVLSIFFYLLISFLSTLFGTPKTILPEDGTLYNKSKGEAFVIKDETVYNAEASGLLNIMVKEGHRVGVGVEVATISIMKDNSDIKQELIEVEGKIGKLNDKNKLKNNEETFSSEVITSIQENINSGNLSHIGEVKEDMLIKEESPTNNNLLNQNLDSLNEKRDSLMTQLNNSTLKYFSSISGIVSFEIDGYERMYAPREFENYTYDRLQLINFEKQEQNDYVNTGEPIYKIINNFEWFMAIKIEDKKDIEKYIIGQSMNIQLEDGTRLNGRIQTINFTGKNAVVILKFSTYLHNDYNLRHANINILHSKIEGYKIPSGTILEKDGLKGVYIKEINGIVKFRPVKILAEEGDFTYIDKGDYRGFIQFGDEEPTKTITLFTEIFLDNKSVTEGEILK